MSDNNPFGFAKLVPGFDFLQNIAKGASQSLPQMPHLSSWVAPTLNVEELEKRITELKAVHFWLEQNGKALGATIQALEVQRMTLATLQGMNFKMGDLANSLKLQPQAPAAKAEKPAPAAKEAKEAKEPKAAKAGNGGAPVDPMHWWGALTQQFQQIAADAMKDVAQKSAVDAARNMAAGVAREAMKAAGGTAKKKPPARKAPARKKAGKA